MQAARGNEKEIRCIHEHAVGETKVQHTELWRGPRVALFGQFVYLHIAIILRLHSMRVIASQSRTVGILERLCYASDFGICSYELWGVQWRDWNA